MAISPSVRFGSCSAFSARCRQPSRQDLAHCPDLPPGGVRQLLGERWAGRPELGGEPGAGGEQGGPVPGQAAALDERDMLAGEHLRAVPGAEGVWLVGQDDEVSPVWRGRLG